MGQQVPLEHKESQVQQEVQVQQEQQVLQEQLD